ncbi:MAG: pro-sigmaK processing inhibitor BofA family protein [Clostridia bacterium]|nr:pro-sigmaK processing inhibitor BofA [Clostridiaceae bacterium]
MKKVLKFFLNVLFGAVFLFFLNRFCAGSRFTLPLNLYTVLCTGIFGVPGVILLISVKYILL